MGFSGRESEDIAGDAVAALNIGQGVGGTFPSRDGPLFTNARVLATGSNTLRTLGDHQGAVVTLKNFGAKGDGVFDDSAAFTAADAVGRTIVISDGTYAINSNLTINSPVIVRRGAGITVGNGYTVTFNGTFYAGVHSVFSGAGTVAFNWKTTQRGFPEWWGAVSGAGDITTATANLAAINKCIVALPTTELQPADYFVSGTIQMNLPHRYLVGRSKRWESSTDAVTRVIVKSATADVVFVGTVVWPGSVDSMLTGCRLSNLHLTRDVLVTPPAGGNEINGAAGVRLHYTRFTYLDQVQASENTIGFVIDGTVQTHLTLCHAFRSLAGSSPTGDFFWGYMQNGSASIGLAGGNASTYYTDCTVEVGGSPTLSDSIGFNLSGKPVDTFMFRPETSAVNQGIVVSGDSGATGNADVHITDAVIDTFVLHGILIQSVGNYGAIDVKGGYFTPASTATDPYGIRVLNSTGMVALTNNQVIGTACPTVSKGLVIQSSSGVMATNNMYLGCARPVWLTGSSSCVVRDIMNNPTGSTGAAAVLIQTSSRCTFAPVVNGGASAFAQGVWLDSTGNSYCEINCTGIDPACINGGANNKLCINSVQILATGLSGNHLVAGVMN